ncbi:MAG: hypothetical protein HYS35_01500 [Betaproteobacteria bacterium]|nr:hypothetical protein [Betaproteobacteria bacterium]
MLRFLERTLGLLVGLVLLAAALVFTSIVLALVAAFAIVIGAWLWWRTRELRRHAAREGGVTIEGEYREERELRRPDDPR